MAMKRVIFAVLAALCIASCSKFDQQDALPEVKYGQLRACFADQTRTYVEDERFLRWHQRDELSVFYGDAVNNKYRFNGQTGDSNGTFVLIIDGTATGSNDPIDRIYALYPRDASAEWVGNGTFQYRLPSEQFYQSESFGQNSNAMVAVTADTADDLLMFKNICGYLKVQLYGDATIKNIVLRTNGGEKISGLAYVAAEYGKDPSVSMSNSGFDLISLNCGEGVLVSQDAANPTDFWFVVPPTTFSKGITITATDVNGKTFTKSTQSRFAIGRNALQPMEALYVKCDQAPVAVTEIKYTATEQITFASNSSINEMIVYHNYDPATGEGVIGLNKVITTIKEAWFAQNEALTSIVIPNGVTTIDRWAFSWCSALQEITIPSSVTEIGFSAFNSAGAIKRVNITDIDAWCKISFGNSSYSTPLYHGARLYVNGEELTVLNVPADVKKVDDYTFYGCSSITEVNIPNGVEQIGYYAFYDCNNLRKVTIGENVNYVGQSAFAGADMLDVIYCRALTPPEIPLTIVSDGSFFEPYSYHSNYGAVRKIIVPLALFSDYKTAYAGSYAPVVFPDVEPELSGNNVIYYQSKDCSIVTPNEVAYFGANIVSNIYENGWGKILFDGDVTEIGINAFAGSKMTEIIIPQSVTIIGAKAFDSSSLQIVHIPKSVTLIESDAFNKAIYVSMVHIDDFASWCNIEFDSVTANPFNQDNLSDYRKFYIDGEPVFDIVIPEQITAIKDYAFYNCQTMSSIYIPKDVKSIGEKALYNCAGHLIIDANQPDYDYARSPFHNSQFKKVTFGDNIEIVGANFMTDCLKLKEVVLGKNLKSLSESAFFRSEYITTVEIKSDLKVEYNPFYACPDLISFVGNNTTEDSRCWIVDGVLMAFARKGITEYTVPDYVKEIGNYAFRSSRLQKVTLPEGLTRIGITAFGAASLQSITIPSSVTEIGDYAFNATRQLVSVVIPDSVTNLGKGVFYEATSLVSAVIGKGITTIPYQTFYKCGALARVTIPEGITSIGNYAFDLCTSLSRITLPQSLTTIGSIVFADCTNLKNIDIPKSVTSIGSSAFDGCKALESIVIPDAVTKINQTTFRNCSSLNSITIGKGVTYIGYAAFSGCTAIKSVYISDLAAWCGVTFYDYSVNPIYAGRAKLYVNGAELTEFVAPAGVTKIGDSTFAGCSSITKIVDMADVTTIGKYAFCQCDNLVSANFEGVTLIYDYAVNNCASLERVWLGSAILSIYKYAFYKAESKLAEVYCSATIPPSIYYGSSTGVFPHLAGTKFYVPREAVDNYLQYTACKDGRYKDNWYLYRDNIIPYDFE